MLHRNDLLAVCVSYAAARYTKPAELSESVSHKQGSELVTVRSVCLQAAAQARFVQFQSLMQGLTCRMRHSCLETSTETVDRPRKQAIASGAAAVSAVSASDSRGRSRATASSFLRTPIGLR